MNPKTIIYIALIMLALSAIYTNWDKADSSRKTIVADHEPGV